MQCAHNTGSGRDPDGSKQWTPLPRPVSERRGRDRYPMFTVTIWSPRGPHHSAAT
jgi:hypothetical protein